MSGFGGFGFSLPKGSSLAGQDFPRCTNFYGFALRGVRAEARGQAESKTSGMLRAPPACPAPQSGVGAADTPPAPLKRQRYYFRLS